MIMYLGFLATIGGLINIYWTFKANEHLKPEYKGRYFPKAYLSKKKYADEVGIQYRNKLFILAAVFLFLAMLPGWINSYLYGESIQNQIYSYDLGDDTVKIDLKKIANFDWDRVYIFDRNISKSEMNRILRFTPTKSRNEQDFVFTKAGKHVHSEEFSFRRDRDITIIFNNGKKYMSFPADSAKFKLSQDFHNDVLSLKPVY